MCLGIKDWVHALLYRPPGTGKTELAAALPRGRACALKLP